MTGPAAARFTAPSGLGLAVYDWGGDGPPVLLAHPTGFHGRAWAPTARRLAASGRRVWSFDFRGHGDSDRSTTGYAWSGFADDVLAVVDHVGLADDDELLAVGHSKGGTSILLAELERPTTFARVWSYEPIVFPSDELLPPHHENPLAAGARRRRAVWASPDEAFTAYASKPPLDVFTPDALHAYVDDGLRERADGQWELKCAPADEAEMYVMGSTHGLYARLFDVGCPLRVACGAHTDAINPGLAEKISPGSPAVGSRCSKTSATSARWRTPTRASPPCWSSPRAPDPRGRAQRARRPSRTADQRAGSLW